MSARTIEAVSRGCGGMMGWREALGLALIPPAYALFLALWGDLLDRLAARRRASRGDSPECRRRRGE